MKPIKIEIPGSIRSKKNSMRPVTIGGVKQPKRVILIPSKAYKKWEEGARKEIKTQLPQGWRVIKEGVSVSVACYYKGKKPDLSGCLESIGDCLEGIVWENDGQIVSWDGSRVVHDKEHPRTIIQVATL